MKKTKKDDLGFIHRFIPGSTSDNVTFLLLHGTGGDENDLIPLAQGIRSTATVLSPRGKVLENKMNRFFTRTAPGQFDLKDLRFRTHELNEFVQQAKKEYELESRECVAIGYSNGANMAVNLMLNYPKTLSAAVLLRPLLPDPPKQTPDLSAIKVLVLGGEADNLITPDQTNELIDYLKKTNAQLTVHWQPVGHGLTEHDVQLAREWLAREFQ